MSGDLAAIALAQLLSPPRRVPWCGVCGDGPGVFHEGCPRTYHYRCAPGVLHPQPVFETLRTTPFLSRIRTRRQRPQGWRHRA